MINITKAEMEYMQTKGCKFGEQLHHSWSRHHKYYLTEAPKLLNTLNNYRRKRLVESHE